MPCDTKRNPRRPTTAIHGLATEQRTLPEHTQTKCVINETQFVGKAHEDMHMGGDPGSVGAQPFSTGAALEQKAKRTDH